MGGLGADADLLVNGYIIDIKSSIEPILMRFWIYQVVGYSLLDFGNSMAIEGVDFYLARQGVFIRWPLAELLPRLTGDANVSLDELRRKFQECVQTKLSYR